MSIFQRKRDATLQEKAAGLTKFKRSTSYAAEKATEELPLIDKAFERADTWIAEHIGNPGELQLPRQIADLLSDLDKSRGTSSQIRQTLRDRDRITADDLWGSRLGGRDTHRLQIFVSEFCTRLSFARGIAASIDRILLRLQYEVGRFEQLGVPQPAPLATPPKPQGPTTPNDKFDPRRPYRPPTV